MQPWLLLPLAIASLAMSSCSLGVGAVTSTAGFATKVAAKTAVKGVGLAGSAATAPVRAAANRNKEDPYEEHDPFAER